MNLLFLCIGNPDGGDDAVGSYIAEILKKEKIDVIDAQTYPENYTGKIKTLKPENLIIIDAIDMNLEPGEIRIVPIEKIGVMTISTHGLPLSLIIGYLEKDIKNIKLVGIQPKKISGEITQEIKKSAKELLSIIKSNKLNEIKRLD